jgi:hypothetical protein
MIPVVTFLRRKMNLKNEIRPSRPADHVRYSPVDHLYQHAPRLISIERCHDFGSLRQPRDGRLEQTWLFRIGFATQAGIARLVLGIRKQHGMGQCINGAFSEDQPPVVRSGMREPQTLFAAGGKAGESAILDLVSAQARGVEMRKDGVAATVDPHTASKPRR